jgi:hypothetical protein
METEVASRYADIFEAGLGSPGYRGTERLMDMNDVADVIDEMHFIIQTLARQDPALVQSAVEEFNRCKRGDEAWPSFMRSNDSDL